MTRVLAVFFLGTLGIAFAALFVRWALPAPPVVTAFYRLAIAMTLLWSWITLTRRPVRASGAALRACLAAGACFGADMAMWNSAVATTSVANATLLVNTTPIWVGLWLLLRRREPMRPALLAGGLLAVAGSSVLVQADGGGVGAWRGDLLALGAALFYAGYLLFIKAAREELEAAQAVAWAGLAATAVVATVALLRGDAFHGFPLRSWASFLAIAVVSHLGGVLGIVWALRELRPGFAAVALLAQPVGTALLGWWLLGEALGPVELLGGSLALAGIALASRAARAPGRLAS